MFNNIPTPATFLASSSVWANAFSTDWFVFVYIAVGVIAAFVLIRFLINIFLTAFEYLGHYHQYGSENRSIQNKPRWYTVGTDEHSDKSHWHFGEM